MEVEVEVDEEGNIPNTAFAHADSNCLYIRNTAVVPQLHTLSNNGK